MADRVDAYLRLKNKVERLKQQEAESRGRLDALLDRMKEEFGCSTLEEAEATIGTMAKTLNKLAKQIEKKLTAFETKYDDKLN